jgi:hypothetical protein
MLESIAAFFAKFATVQWSTTIGSSLAVAATASLIRIFFTKNKGWLHSLGTFFGGVLVGTLVGYVIKDVSAVADYQNAIVAAVSIGAREFVEWLIGRFEEIKRMKLAYLLPSEKFRDYRKNQRDDKKDPQ